jgi:hypothetical protein
VTRIEIEQELKRLQRGLKAARRRIADLEESAADPEDDQPLQRIFPAEVSGDGTWQEQTIEDGDLVDFTDGRECDDAADESAVVDRGTASFLMEFTDSGGVHRYVEIGSMSIVPLLVTKTDGFDGTSTSPATWTYGATQYGAGLEPWGDSSAMSPVWNRPNGSVIPAEHGLGIVIGGQQILWMVDEVPNDRICNPGV